MNVYVFYSGSICIHVKELLRQFTFHQKYRENLTLNNIFEISEQLIVGQSDEIFGVSPMKWEDSPWKQLSLVNDEEVISLSHAKVYVLSDSVLCLGKVNPKPTSFCLGRKIELFQKFIRIQNLGHNGRRADGILVEYFPRIPHIGAGP